MVDSQADISVIKFSCIKAFTLFNKNNIINITGVTNQSITTLGTICTNLIFQGYFIPQIFHVVDDNFNIPTDGILGKDFLKTYMCKINYESMFISFWYNDDKLQIPIRHGTSDNNLIVPPRCEVFRTFKLQNVKEPIFIDTQEICDGVFVSKCVVDSNKPILKIMNVTDELKCISNYDIKFDALSNYKVYSINRVNPENNRILKLKNLLKNQMPTHISDELVPLCERYNDIFALEEDKMTVNNFYNQELRLTDSSPVYVKNYRMPHSQREEIDRKVKELLDNDLIEPSRSNFNSPLILVPKKSTDGQKSFRMCVDYRAVNKKLVADKFPLPRIDDVLDNLGRAKYFSVLDLFSGFHQIPLHINSRDITSFSTSSGSFRWKVLPFGLNIAPNSFSRMMSIAFSGLPPDQAFLYVDDIIVIGCSVQHHLENLENVFKVFRKFNLKLNPYKCNFFRPDVTFLGHKCTNKGLLPDDSKIKTIEKYPTPTDKDSVKRFVAFANYYRRFIRNFASLAAPLNYITRKKVPFKWDDKCENAFEQLKQCLKSPELLQYPDFAKEFTITVDASKVGCGAVLSQDFDGNDLPIYFASKSFNSAERKKPTIEQELLAIHFAIKQFRPYVYGTKFRVRSDHRPLVYLFGIKDPSSKLTRIRLELSEYNFTIEHIKGKDNVAADALSRISIDELKDSNKEVFAMTTRGMSKRQQDVLTRTDKSTVKIPIYDKFSHDFSKQIPKIRSKIFYTDNKLSKLRLNIYKKFKMLFSLEFRIDNKTLNLGEMLLRLEEEAINSNTIILEWPKDDIFFTICSIQDLKDQGLKSLNEIQIMLTNPIERIFGKEEKEKLMTIYHNDPLLGGHCGRHKLYAKLRTKYFWKNMTKDIANFIRNCDKCNHNKVRPGNKEQLILTPTPTQAFDIVVLDTIGPLPESTFGNRYALTLICDLTKYLVTIPIPNKDAKTVARAIFEKFVLIYGAMNTIKSDLGTEFKNQVLTELCDLFKIRINYSTAYHHETLGTVERSHRVFNEYLRAYVDENISDWDTYLNYFTFFHNTNPNTVFDTKFSPYELVFGKLPVIPSEIAKTKTDPLYNIENYSKEVKYRLQKTHQLAKELIEKHKLRNKRFFDRHSNPLQLTVNEKVLLQKQPYDKFKSIYEGPFIVKSINDCNVTLYDNKTKKSKTVHKNRLRKF